MYERLANKFVPTDLRPNPNHSHHDSTRGRAGISFIGALSLLKAPPLLSNHFWDYLNTIAAEFRASAYELGRDKNIHTIDDF